MSLAAELDRIRDDPEDTPELRAAVAATIAELRRGGVGEHAPRPGDPFPDFLLPDLEGRLVELADLTRAGPFALTFFRGPWCPYCTASLRANLAALPCDPRGGRAARRGDAGDGRAGAHAGGGAAEGRASRAVRRRPRVGDGVRRGVQRAEPLPEPADGLRPEPRGAAGECRVVPPRARGLRRGQCGDGAVVLCRAGLLHRAEPADVVAALRALSAG
jgi:hypothetical protein